MRVLLVTPSYFPIIGGSEVLTQILFTKLNEQGVHSDIMTFNMDKKWNPTWKEETTTDGSTSLFREGAFTPFYPLHNPLSNLFGINVVPNLRFIRKFSGYDIIHFVGEADLSFPMFSYFVKKPKLFQCVGLFRKGGIYKYYNSDRVFFGKIFKKVFPRIANRFVISSPEERELLATLGVPESKIVLLPLGVDTEIFRPDPSKKTENLLLFVGRIDRIKGIHTLMQALQYIETPSKVVVIGPPWDSKYVKEIENMSKAINASGRHSVNLMGALDSKDLVPWYQKASVLVCPYIFETHSNVVREALACGTPVVSTGSHLVENCSDGILIAQQNPKDLAKVLNNLLAKPQLCQTLGKQGRSVIEQYFSWNSVISELITLYENTLRLFPYY